MSNLRFYARHAFTGANLIGFGLMLVGLAMIPFAILILEGIFA